MEKSYEADNFRLEANVNPIINTSDQISERKITWNSCVQCSYKSKYKSHLKQHIEAKHEDFVITVTNVVIQ